jgi:toxin ParE1/3/4
VNGRILWHPDAFADVETTAVYIGIHRPDAALRFIDAVDSTLNRLVASPEIGVRRFFSRSENADIRSFPVRGFEKHLVFYVPTQAGIEVFRVLHGARDVDARFDE